MVEVMVPEPSTPRDDQQEEVDLDEENLLAEIDEEKLLILPLNDASSKKISQIIASDTARTILEVLASAPRSTSEIAERLGIPLTTVQYNLEKLCDAGLVKVERTRYSRKMKPMKLYAPQRKFVVIAPVKTDKKDVIAALKRYLTVIAVAAVGSVAVELLASRMGRPLEDFAIKSVPEAGGGAPTPLYAPLPAPVADKGLGAGLGFDFFAHPGLWFLLGCLFVIALVVLIEYRGVRSGKRR
jgi:DNA-binding Lrp family transcriptional regulator